MNQTEFSEKTGLSQPWVSQILSGQREMGKASAKRIAILLDLPWTQVLTMGADELRERVEKL